jgi:transglutaminase-like putative cysteine protease
VNLQINVQLDYGFERSCDVLMQIEAAAIPGQRIAEAHFVVSSCDHFARVPAQDHIGERIWLRTEGQLLVDYRATVSIERQASDVRALTALPPHRLPGETVQYLLPSRYCPSHQFTDFVEANFGTLQGGAKIAAISDWIAGHLSYVPGSSHSETTATDTFHDAQGVCRDYAHLLITLARAGEVPARIASVYAPGVSPPDFHAVAEVFLGGEWHLVDPTGMAHAAEMATIGIGRDSGDVAFLTAFGPLVMNSQSVSVQAIGVQAATD